MTVAPRSRRPSIRSGFVRPYSWTATRLPATGSSASRAARSSRQVLGSGTSTSAVRPSSRSAATGLGPRTTMRARRSRAAKRSAGRRAGGGKGAGADPGEQDDHVDGAVLQRRQQLGRFGAGVERHLAHRRRAHRGAAAAADQLRHLGRAPALEGEHRQAVESAAHGGTLSGRRWAVNRPRRPWTTRGPLGSDNALAKAGGRRGAWGNDARGTTDEAGGGADPRTGAVGGRRPWRLPGRGLRASAARSALRRRSGGPLRHLGRRHQRGADRRGAQRRAR